MDESYPRVVRWDRRAAVAEARGDTPAHAVLSGPHNPAEFAKRLYASEALNPAASVPKAHADFEPYTLQWFLDIETQRHGRHGRWIPKLLEFAKHSGERLLGLGHGLGTDWLQYARHGAHVVVCSASTSHLSLIRRNFELRGLRGQFHHASPTALPLDAASIDVACVTSLLEGNVHPQGVVDEVYRILKPGGKVLAVTGAKYDVDYWFDMVYFWYRWLRRREASTDASSAYSARQLRRLFSRFVEHRVHKRQLRRSEVPHIWRWLPTPLLARMMGRRLVLKAFKPLSAAIAPLSAAA